jgi:ubiquinone/menaquinone biosynthesis C-methylase UbiE
VPADYDAVADQYDATFQALPYRIFVEEWSVLNALGDVDQRSVLELATGTGHYARRLRRLGAGRVVAVDLSAEMIALAQEAEDRAPLGIRYQVHDVATLELEETFDVVIAVYLLHYMPPTWITSMPWHGWLPTISSRADASSPFR